MKILKMSMIVCSLANVLLCMEVDNQDLALIAKKNERKKQEEEEQKQKILYYALKGAVNDIDEKKIKQLLDAGAPLYIKGDDGIEVVQLAFENLWCNNENLQSESTQKRYKIIEHFLDAGLPQKDLLTYMSCVLNARPCPNFVKFCWFKVDKNILDQQDIKMLLRIVPVLEKYELLNLDELFSTYERKTEALFAADILKLKFFTKNFEWWFAKDSDGNTIFHNIANKSKKDLIIYDCLDELNFLCYETPYHGSGEKIDAIKELLSTKNNDGKTPLDIIQDEIKSISIKDYTKSKNRKNLEKMEKKFQYIGNESSL